MTVIELDLFLLPTLARSRGRSVRSNLCIYLVSCGRTLLKELWKGRFVKTFVRYLLLFPLAVVPLAAQPVTFDFSQPVVLSPVEAPGTWYTDRYPPRGWPA